MTAIRAVVKKRGVRVTPVTVGVEFEEQRTLLIVDSPVPGILDSIPVAVMSIPLTYKIYVYALIR